MRSSAAPAAAGRRHAPACAAPAASAGVHSSRSYENQPSNTASTPPSTPGLKSVDSLFNDRFGGDFDKRREDDSLVLKKGLPAQPVMRNESEYVMSQASRVASGFKDLRRQHEELLKELVVLQSQYDMYMHTCTELCIKLDHERQCAVDRLAESEQLRTTAILESVKVKNQKRDVEATQKRQREIELETAEWRHRLADAESKRREVEKRLAAAELVAASQFKLVQTKRTELDRASASLASLHKHHEEELQMQRAKYAQQLAQSRTTLAGLRDQEAAALQQLEQLQLERDRVMGDLAKKQTQISILEDRARKAKESLSSKDDNVHMALQTLGKAQENSEQRLAELKQEISLHWQKCEAATRECNQFQNELSESASRITRVQMRVDTLAVQEADWRQQLAEAETKYHEHAAVLHQAQQDLAGKLHRVGETRVEKDAAVAALQEEQSVVMQTVCALDQSRDMERNLRSELQVMRNALDQLHAPPPPPAAPAPTAAAAAVDTEQQPVVRNEYEQQIDALESELAAIKRQLAESDVKRRNLLNQVHAIKGNVRVLVRVGPSNNSHDSVVACSLDGMSLQLLHADSARFSFNRVFDSEASQLDVFEEVAPFVQSALDGYHVGLLCMGQRGAGKTYTMFGDASSRGLVPRSVEHVVRQAVEMSAEWTVRIECGFVELAAEDDNAAGRDLLGVKRLPVPLSTGAEDVLGMIQRASSSSSSGTSYSSHRVFSLFIQGRNDTTRAELQGSLHLCDLAAGIPDAALAGLLLKQRAGGSSSAAARPAAPTKLVELIKPCLSGEGKTLMIASVSPSEADAVETAALLRFAQQVNQAEPGSATITARRAL